MRGAAPIRGVRVRSTKEPGQGAVADPVPASAATADPVASANTTGRTVPPSTAPSDGCGASRVAPANWNPGRDTAMVQALPFSGMTTLSEESSPSAGGLSTLPARAGP